MLLYGDLFLSEIAKKSVFDSKGEVLGRVKDAAGVRGDLHPKVSVVSAQEKTLGGGFTRLFQRRIQNNLTGWRYSRPVLPNLRSNTLAVPRWMVAGLYSADWTDSRLRRRKT